MIQQLCDILRQELVELVTIPGGLATVWKSNDRDKGSKPAFWDYIANQHKLLTPDADYAAITFFEERGTAIQTGIGNTYTAELTLIGWVNTAKGVNTPALIENIRRAYYKKQLTYQPFNSIKVEVTGLLPESEQLFSKYKLDTGVRKYLQKPYDAFGLTMRVSFNVNPEC